MAKKHLLEATGLLLKKYDKAQDLYEKVAEIFSEEMVSPEELKIFNEIKEALDSALSMLSTFLSEAYLHPDKFLKHFYKLCQMGKEFDRLAQDNSFTDDVRLAYHNKFIDCLRSAEVAKYVDQLRVFPKSVKRQKKHFGVLVGEVLQKMYYKIFTPMCIDNLLITLELFIKEE